MRRIALAITACVLSFNAVALKAVENGYAWNKASSAERDALVRDAMSRVKVNYPNSEMSALTRSMRRQPRPMSLARISQR